jgi:hypothetical protein
MSRAKPVTRESSVKPPTVRIRLIIGVPCSRAKIMRINRLEAYGEITIARYVELP